MPIVQPGLLKRPGMGSCRLLGAEPMSDWTVYHIQNRKKAVRHSRAAFCMVV